MESRGEVVEMVSMRSLLRKGDERALAEVKGISPGYPLYGEAKTDQPGSLTDLLAPVNGVHGLVTERVIAERLALEPGDEVKVGGGTFIFRGVLTQEPDRASGGFAMGPRVLTSVEGLREAGMLQPGVLFQAGYRLKLPEDADLLAEEAAFEKAFPEAGARWRDRRAAAPGIQRFVDRLGAFLTIVGIAALAVGGVGIGAAVRGYLTRKVPTIAALRTLGASAGDGVRDLPDPDRPDRRARHRHRGVRRRRPCRAVRSDLRQRPAHPGRVHALSAADAGSRALRGTGGDAVHALAAGLVAPGPPGPNFSETPSIPSASGRAGGSSRFWSCWRWHWSAQSSDCRRHRNWRHGASAASVRPSSFCARSAGSVQCWPEGSRTRQSPSAVPDFAWRSAPLGHPLPEHRASCSRWV